MSLQRVGLPIDRKRVTAPHAIFDRLLASSVEIATGFVSDALQKSHYRRIQRFIPEHFLSYDKVAWFVMSLFGFLDAPFYLAMDRTNLMLAVVCKGVAIPIYWLLLDKKGNSDTRERIAIVKRFIRQFGEERLLAVPVIAFLLGAPYGRMAARKHQAHKD